VIDDGPITELIPETPVIVRRAGSTAWIGLNGEPGRVAQLKEKREISLPNDTTGYAWTWRAQDPKVAGKWEDSADGVGGTVYPTVREPLFMQEGNPDPDDYVFVQPGARDTREGDLNYGLEWYAWPIGGKGSNDTAFLTPVELPLSSSLPVYPAFRRIQIGLPATWQWDQEPMYLYGANGEALKRGWNYLAHVNKDRIQDQYGRSLKAWATYCCPPIATDSGPGGPGDYGQPPWHTYARIGCCPVKKFSRYLTLSFQRIQPAPPAAQGGWCDLNGVQIRLFSAPDVWGGSSPPVEAIGRDGWYSDAPALDPVLGGFTFQGVPTGAVCEAGYGNPWQVHAKFFCLGEATSNARGWGLRVSVLMYNAGHYEGHGQIFYTTAFGSCIAYPPTWICAGGSAQNPSYMFIDATFGNVGPPVFPNPITPGGPCPWEGSGFPTSSWFYKPASPGGDWYIIRVSG
jgi:hypothetical protein